MYLINDVSMHPVAQVTLIIVMGAVILGVFLAMGTDFWDNIGKKK